MNEKINQKIHFLGTHKLYQNIKTLKDLRFFMERHVYAVLDFMSLLYAVKRHITPQKTFWTPPSSPDLSRLINEIVLSEESDICQNGKVLSHFQLYIEAMREIGADTSKIENFLKNAPISGLEEASKIASVPESSVKFMRHTFSLIEKNRFHEIAASFCYGREKSIPSMFKEILSKFQISEEAAPTFYWYIKRHIEIDGDEHSHMSEKLLSFSLNQDINKRDEAASACLSSLEARLTLWTDIELELKSYLN